MFWRRSHKEERRSSASGQADDGADDLARLQRQFGIKPVKDADVQAEYEKLFNSNDQRLLLGADDSDEDEEARILRSLQLDGSMPTGALRLSQIGVDAEDDDHGVQQLLASITRTTTTTTTTTTTNTGRPTPAPAPASADAQERVRAMKLQALALKREGRIPEALAMLRQAKDLEAQPVPAPVAANSTPMAEDDVPDVTDEDMNDPEYLAQLAAMGLAVNPPAKTVESLGEQIRQLKTQALDFKRQNQIPDALACMRKIKELEAELLQLQPVSPQATTAVEVLTATAVAAENRSSSVTTQTATSTSYVVQQQQSMDDEDVDPDVTEEDMNDPAFAAELSKLGFGNFDDDGSTPPAPSSTLAPASVSTPVAMEPVPPSPQAHVALQSSVDTSYRPPSQSLQCQQSSFDDELLIDEFEDDDEMAEDPPAPMRSYAVLATQAPPPPSEIPESVSEGQAELVSVESSDIAELRNQLQKAKESALRLKREGNVKEAIEAMRRMKQIENLLHLKEQKNALTPESKPVSPDMKRFQGLEQLLVDFANRATAHAKEHLSTNRAMAAEFLAKRKAYAAQLETLREKRLNPLQRAPTFTIERKTEQVEFQLPTIPEDQLHVSIRSVNCLNAMAGKDFFVKFSLNFPSATPHEGKTGLARISSREPYSATQISAPNLFRFQVSRGRGTQRLFEIKKAVFEVWRPGTMLRNPELVARAYQELTPFLSSCQVNCRIPFVGPNRKPSGGDVEISIQLRYPLRDKEMQSFTTEELVVGEYPTPVSAPAFQDMAMPSVALQPSPSTEAKSRSAATTPRETQKAEASSPSVSIDEDFDPHHPDLIVSYDVMNEELEKIEAKLSALTGAVAEEWTDRYDSLSLKKQLLEIEMQTGKLTIEMYTERLQKRIGEDKQLMAQLLRANRRIDAARVLRRVKIMEKELDSTEPEE